MKKLLILFACIFLNLALFAQAIQVDTSRVFCKITYHKINPGYTIENAIEIEKIWKIVHTARKDAGLITGYAVYLPFQWAKTPNAEFDFLTVNWGNNLDNLNSYPEEMVAALLKKYPQHANLWEKTLKIYGINHQEFYSMKSFAGDWGKPDQIYLFETMKVSESKYLEYLDLEKKGTPVHQERVNNGVISHWSFWERIAPTGYLGHIYFTTINAFPSLSRLEEGGYSEGTIKKTMNMTLPEAMSRFANLRSKDASWLVTVADSL